MTVCIHKHECILGEIIDGEIHLSEYGKVVEEEWQRSSKTFKEINLDSYQVMPNHFHGIIFIADRDDHLPIDRRGTACCAQSSELNRKFNEGTARRAPCILLMLFVVSIVAIFYFFTEQSYIKDGSPSAPWSSRPFRSLVRHLCFIRNSPNSCLGRFREPVSTRLGRTGVL